MMNVSRWFHTAGLLLAAMFTLSASEPLPPSAGSDVTVPAVVQRFLQREEEPLTSYRVLRRLEAHNPRYKKHGWLEAWVTLDPIQGFSYEIVGEGGSSYVRSKVLRKTLAGEAETYATLRHGAAALVPANYTFTDRGKGSDGLVAIGVEPRRKETVLVRGQILLTSDDADLVRVEGELAKSPSFWTRRVDIVRTYQRIGAVRVPVAMESTAKVVLAGESTFSMKYEYASINGREVGQPQPRETEVPLPEVKPRR